MSKSIVLNNCFGMKLMWAIIWFSNVFVLGGGTSMLVTKITHQDLWEDQGSGGHILFV